MRAHDPSSLGSGMIQERHGRPGDPFGAGPAATAALLSRTEFCFVAASKNLLIGLAANTLAWRVADPCSSRRRSFEEIFYGRKHPLVEGQWNMAYNTKLTTT